jgi:hypothetical protein
VHFELKKIKASLRLAFKEPTVAVSDTTKLQSITKACDKKFVNTSPLFPHTAQVCRVSFVAKDTCVLDKFINIIIHFNKEPTVAVCISHAVLVLASCYLQVVAGFRFSLSTVRTELPLLKVIIQIESKSLSFHFKFFSFMPKA